MRATVVALGAVSALALTGCSDGAGAQPGPSKSGPPSSTTTASPAPSSTASTTASPSGTATVTVPAAARAHTEEGAKAFAEFYVKAVSESGYTADSATLNAITDPACKGCQVFIELADELKASGHRVDRKSIELRDMVVRPGSNDDVIQIDCLVEDRPSKIVDAQGNVISDEPGDKLTLRNTVKWTGERWVLHESLLVEN